MGKLRARTDEELAARKNEILNAARKQLMTIDYDAITLATIAEQTSISRPSMYHYYEKKENVFTDLMIQEYEELNDDLQIFLKRKMARERFCRKLASILWERQLLLKLLSLQLPVWRHEYSDDNWKKFVEETAPYQETLKSVLIKQFPNATDEQRNMFRIQFSVYCNSLYVIEHLPESQMKAMEKSNFFDSIPKGEDICYEGLILLSAVMSEE
ncbi:MAG: TetR/AcrR family transcriptional regulator [Lachnospiraceae bacterium]|nr:TetR/AcrR family transcriptional regulator [Lachnospiraceae bacterium]